LLFRFYDPSDDEFGVITIDGQDIKTVTLESLRQNIAVVPQDLVLFNETIRYNIAYGRCSSQTVLAPEELQAEIEKCAKIAHIHDQILKMPDGYNTVVGERGLKLSGGEKQRICLARALMKNPPILLLDEVTSGLDADSEQHVQLALEEITKERTVLMISHRLKTVQSCDLILVFDGGQVVESGAHAQLMTKNGLYSSLVKKQTLLQ